MAGIQDFVTKIAAQLGIGEDAARSATGAIAGLVQKAAGSADFGKLAAAVPGLGDLAAKAGSSGGGGGLAGAFGGLAQKAAGALGGTGGAAAGAAAAVAAAGVPVDKAPAFLSSFVAFLKSKVSPDLLKTVLAKVPALSGLLG